MGVCFIIVHKIKHIQYRHLLENRRLLRGVILEGLSKTGCLVGSPLINTTDS